MLKQKNWLASVWFRTLVILVVAIGLGWLFLVIYGYSLNQSLPPIDKTIIEQQKTVDPRLTQVTTTTPTFGNPGSKIVIVEFGDFQCPFCLAEFSIIRQVMQKYQDQIFFIWRQFPIAEKHPQAAEAAEASICAQEQNKFWSFHDQLFLNQNDLSAQALLVYAEKAGLDRDVFIKCMASHKYRPQIVADLQLGLDNGVRGTPTFFINGHAMAGVLPLEFWTKAIELLAAGQ